MWDKKLKIDEIKRRNNLSVRWYGNNKSLQTKKEYLPKLLEYKNILIFRGEVNYVNKEKEDIDEYIIVTTKDVNV